MMYFTSEQVAGRMGLSTNQISDLNIETINLFLEKFTIKVFNLNFLDAKWKTFTFRNKVKNMSNVNEALINKFLDHIEEQCKKMHINMIINDEIKVEANEGIPVVIKAENTESVLPQIKKRKLDITADNTIDTSDDSMINGSSNETIYKTPESSRIMSASHSVLNSNRKTKQLFQEAFTENEYDLTDKSMKHDQILKTLLSEANIKANEKTSLFEVIDPHNHSFKIMRDSTTKLAKLLDDQLDFNKENFDFAISDPTIQSQSSIFTIGRIVIDGIEELDPVFETKNLALETSQHVGIGKRIKIDVSNLPKGTDLFLGQVVVCKGKNITGKEFIIEDLIKERTDLNHDIECFGDFTVVSVNGPFCNEKNLNYSIFETFIKEKINNVIKPTFLILNGPLIDISNHCFITGIIPTFQKDGKHLQIDSIDDIFSKVVYPILQSIDSKINVFIVPHSSETISKYTTYPQPSYLAKLQVLLAPTSVPKNLHFINNPSIINLNGLNFGVNNIDIFKNLKNVNIDNLFMNRFKTITKLMIENKSFYPSFPTIPSLNDKATSLKLGKELFQNEEGEKDAENNINYNDLIVTRNRMNKNIAVDQVSERCNIPKGLNINFMLHNSSYVPHLEQIDKGCISINSSAFHQGNKLGFYTVIRSTTKDANSCNITTEIKRV